MTLDEAKAVLTAAVREPRSTTTRSNIKMMRAKMQVTAVVPTKNAADETTSETLSFAAVAKSGGYPPDGSDEDNSYARWSPSGHLTITVANPNLFGKFAYGDKFYLDFTKAE